MARKKISPRSPNASHVLIGQRLRAARLKAGFSQEELGVKLGVTFQQIQKYEKGTNRMDVSRMLQAAEFLGVNGNYFVEGLHEKRGIAKTEFDTMLATREGVQVIEAMIELTAQQRQFVIDVARKLPSLAA